MSRNEHRTALQLASALALAGGSLRFDFRDEEAIELLGEKPNADNFEALSKRQKELFSKLDEMVRDGNKAGGMNPEQEAEYTRTQEEYEKVAKQRDRYLEFLRRTRGTDARRFGAKSGALETTAREEEILAAARGGRNPLVFRERACQVSREYGDAFGEYLKRGEKAGPSVERAMSEGSDADGGVLPPIEYHGMLFESIDQESVMRSLATVLPVGSFKRELPIEDDVADSAYNGAWNTETGAATENTPQFSKVTMQPRVLRRLIKHSLVLAEDAPARGSGFSMEALSARRLGRIMGMCQEYGFCQGDGAASLEQPKGIFTYTTGTTISTGVTSAVSSFTADNLIALVFSLPQKFRVLPGCAILCSDATVGLMAQLKNVGAGGSGYLLQRSADEKFAGRIHGVPVVASPFAPDIAAAGVYGVIGDFKQYLIFQRTAMSLQVLRELYAGTGQIGHLGTMRLDGKCIRTSAFRYLKAAAS